MSDPARDGFTCCDQPMVPMVTADIELALGEMHEPCAYGCMQCFKWRYAVPPGHAFRPLIHKSMTEWSDRKYRESGGNHGNR